MENNFFVLDEDFNTIIMDTLTKAFQQDGQILFTK